MAASQCEKCGGVLKRSRRNFAQRLLYSEIVRCESCKRKQKTSAFKLKNIRYVKCPRCHSVDLSVLKRRDGIDRMYYGPFSLMHRLLGGKLYHCWFCRLQFHDLRPRLNKGKDSDEQNDIEMAS